MAQPGGFEPPTVRLEGGCSIQLSYGCVMDYGIIRQDYPDCQELGMGKLMESVIYPKNLEELKEHTLRSIPSIYIGSKTSTVIPYDQEEGRGNISWVNLSRIKGEIEFFGENAVRVRGNITWLDMKQFCQSEGFEILTSPTEESALVLSGLATSCTGERCFGHGTLRDQVVSLKYLNNRAEEVELLSSDPIEKVFDGGVTLKNYQNDYKAYQRFKNAPYPRFEKATDLQIGAEGQLGVITECRDQGSSNRG